MEKFVTKLSLSVFFVSAVAWLFTSGVKHYYTGSLIQFGTVEIIDGIDPAWERTVYGILAEYSIVAFGSYLALFGSGIGYLVTTRRSPKKEGWLLMSAILFFGFVPVELYCFWLDWKIVGLHYWGSWPLEEFRKAFLLRLTALAGLPFIAQLCYYTIPIFVIFKPLRKQDE